MNKIRTHFLALLAVMLLGTGVANAATDYGIIIGETRVTSDNASNILGNGQFSYNASTKTLTVTNANLNNQGSLGSGIRNDDVDGFIIRLVGTSTLTTRMNGISSDKNFSITGTGTLNVTAGSRGIITYGQNTAVTCTINGPTLNITASNYPFEDYYGTTTLIVKGADTRLTLNTGSTRNVVNNLKSMTVSDGLKLVYPYGSVFSTSSKSVTYSGSICKGTVSIGVDYGMYIGETRVTSYNYNDVNGDDMFVYRPASKTLDVRSGSFTNTGSLGNGIDNREIDGLTIHLSSSPINITARNYAIYSEKSFSIVGPGTLNATSNTSPALVTGGSASMTFTIGPNSNGRCPTINLKGVNYGIRDYYGNTTLALKGANTVLSIQPGSGYAAIYNLNNMTFSDGLDIVTPSGPSVSFYPSLKSVSVNGSDAYKGKVEIAYDYGIFVGETKVSKLNYADILGNGQFKYNPDSKTLNVSNATLDNQGAFGNGIDNRLVDDLIINLSGTNKISARNAAVSSARSISFTGSGTLDAFGNYASALSFWASGSKTCTVNGPTLNLSSNSYVLDDYDGNTTLTMAGTGSKITMEQLSGDYPTVHNLNGLSLGNYYITEPAGAAYSSSLKSITLDGSTPTKDKVLISRAEPRFDLWIGNTGVTALNAKDILGNGQFKYEPATRTLTLTNASLTTDDYNGIVHCGIQDLTVNVQGDNSLSGPGYVFGTVKSINFTGTGTLTLTSTSGDGFTPLSISNTDSVNALNCVFDGPKVYLRSHGSGSAISASYENIENVIVRGTSTILSMQSGDKGNGIFYLIDDFKIDSDKLYYLEPAGVYFDTNMKNFAVDGKRYDGTVVVGPEIDYGFFVGEKVVTSLNCKDINGDGQFRYDPETNTLTVTNAKFENIAATSDATGTVHRGNAIENWSNSGLKVVLVGENTFTTRMAAFAAQESMTITGSGSLNATSTTSSPIYLSGRSTYLTINGPKLNLKGATYGIDGDGDADITIEGSSTELVLEPGSGYDAVNGIGYMDIKNVAVITPYGAKWNSYLHSLTLDGQTAYKGKVEIKYNFGIYVAERLINLANYSDVLGDGAFKYDPATRTLTVTNAKLDNQGSLGSGISNREVDDLKINLVGTSTFSTRLASVSSRRSFSFTGSGTLNAKSTEAYALYLVGENMTCTVDGPTLRFTGTTYGLKSYKTGTTLYVKGAPSSISLQTTGDRDLPTVNNLGTLRMDNGVTITSPRGAYFNSSLKSITTDGTNPTKEKVVIGTKTDYGMYIAETLVTFDNYRDVLGDGQFSYDPQSKTLTVRNANLNNQGSLGSGISNREIEDLTINLVGENRLYCRMAAINSSCSFTITGTGSLRATSMEAYALYLTGDNMTCTIDGPQITFMGAKWGLRSYKSTTTLNVKGADTNVRFQAMGLNTVPIENLGHLNLSDGLQILEPQGAHFSESLKSVTLDDKTVYDKHVVIGKPVDYGMYIAETRVTSANNSDVLGDGAFSYNPQTKTLTVRNANLENNGTLGSAIDNRDVEDLVINFVGTNTFNTRMSSVYSEKDFTMTGTGTLNATSKEAYCLYLAGQDITCYISGPSLSFTGATYGVQGYYGSEKLRVSGTNTVLTLNSPENSPTVYNIAAITLDSLSIMEPRGAYFDRSLKSITTDGSTAYTGKIVMGYKQDYGIYIAETMVSSANYRDVLGDGQFSYDPWERVLTVRNANLTNKGSLGSGISNREVEDLTIVLEGNNTIDARMAAVSSRYNCVLTGNGTLNATSSQAYALYLTGDDMTFTINGPKVSFTGATYGLKSYKPTTTLEVSGSTTNVTFQSGARYSTIYNLADLYLDSLMTIVTPAGAFFEPDMLMSVTTDGNSACTGKIVIGPRQDYDIRIAETMVNSDNAADVLGDGAFSYDADTKTLTVRNAAMRNDGFQGSGISNLGVEGLNIKFEGTNTIDVRNNVIYAKVSTNVIGNGTLKGYSWGSKGIFLGSDCQTFTIDGPTLDITGTGNGLEDYTKNATLRISGENTYVTLQSKNSSYYHGIGNLYQFELGDGLYITEPDGGWFSPDLGGITTDGQTLTLGAVVISNKEPQPEDYGFFVAETRVTSANANDVFGNGQFSYNPQNKTLTVRNANLSNDGGLGCGISNREVDGLVINLVGSNKFNTRMATIDSYKSFSITGTGSLTAQSTDYCNLYLWGADTLVCTINGPKLDFTSYSNSIRDYSGTADVEVKGTGTTVKMQPLTGSATISNLNGLFMDRGLYVTKPYEGYFDFDLRSITDDGDEPFCGLVIISSEEPKPDYFAVENDTTTSNYHATSDNTCEVTGVETASGTDEVTVVEIPETVGEYTVVGVAASAFEWNYVLEAVYLPATIEAIGYNAFSNCPNLMDVYMHCQNAPQLLDMFGQPTDDNGAFEGLTRLFDDANPTWGARALANTVTDGDDGSRVATLHVPSGRIDAYNVTPWNEWFSYIVDDITTQSVKGDVNGDGTVNVADIGAVIDMMASSGYSKAADVNGDGNVDVADIGTIIDIMAANARRLKMTYGE